MTIGKRISATRKQARLTQVQLAEKCGVATITIQQYELDKRQPRLEQLSKIAAALGVTVSDLVDDNYWSTLSDAERKAAFAANPYKELLNGLFDQLNPEGQQKAVERVEELTEIPKYKK